MKLSDGSLRRPVTVLVLTAAVLVLGTVSLSRMKLDFLPKVDFPFIGVWAPYPNAVPAQVEREIARPIEEVFATLGDVRQIRSYSDEDGAWVQVRFDFGRPVDVLRMEVQEKLEQVRPRLPADLRDTFVFTFNSNDIPVMVGRISSRGKDLSASYDLLERRIFNPLRRVEGVGRVTVDGIAPKGVTIYLDLDAIVAHSVDVERLFALLNRSNLDLTAGRVRDGHRRIAVRTLGQFRSLEELRDLPVTPAGVRLRDIADVVYAEPAPGYHRRLNGEPAVGFEIQKASGANIVEVSRRVGRLLDRAAEDPTLEGIDVVLFFDQADEITGSLRSLLQSGLIGAVFAVLVLLVFLRRLRATSIVSVAIPLSVVGTCVFLYLTGRTLNVLTMMGLMLAVGMLVDNAIVVLEAIHRRREKGDPARRAASIGAREVGVAVTASTLTSVIVYAPIVLSKGSEVTVWLAEVGVTISVTLLFSLLICLTLVPLLAARAGDEKGGGEARILGRLRERYLRLLRWTAIRHPKRTGLVFLPLFLLATIAAMQITGLEPEAFGDRGVKQDNLRVEIDFLDNKNVYGVRPVVRNVESTLLEMKDSLGVESVYAFYRDNYAGFTLFFEPGVTKSEKEIREIRSTLRERLPDLAGVEYLFGTEEEAGRGAQRVSVTLFGEDTDRLASLADEVRRRMALLPGLREVRTDLERGRDEVRVSLDRSRAGAYGLDARSLAKILGLTF
ncbi:MAG: MMPL family transporter, partial [Candidatus Eisenbacteria bacterium]|nr:MMPL family transporter [Candidatus Latescibacterota bacterium]MBD3302280.1 MMPL family transporter [Candidatus Eisenbacteria bacterium]